MPPTPQTVSRTPADLIRDPEPSIMSRAIALPISNPNELPMPVILPLNGDTTAGVLSTV